jgi:hypothetical protein
MFSKFSKLFELVADAAAIQDANIGINLKLNIAEILSDSSTDGLYEQSKKNKTLEGKFKNKEEWASLLIENFKKRHQKLNPSDHTHKGKRYVWGQVNFNIKGNLLIKNKEIDFSDIIQHRIDIPFEYTEKEEMFEDDVTIRLVVVNGILKIQVGHFDKETSPEHLRKGGLAIYKKFATVTSFPLMYVFFDMPSKYLNLSFYATPSYWKLMSGQAKDNSFNQEWIAANAEFNDYKYLNNPLIGEPVKDNVIKDQRWLKIIQSFAKKGKEWLARENFTDPDAEKESDGYTPGWLKNDSLTYMNDYLSVHIADYKKEQEKMNKYELVDYYQETP